MMGTVERRKNIEASFSNILQGWWQNLDQEERRERLQALADKHAQQRPDLQLVVDGLGILPDECHRLPTPIYVRLEEVCPLPTHL